MNCPCVSVIMPVYNAAKFLDESLGGLLKQTLHDIEIICVNDGSKDNSLDIIKQYASRDPRIVIIDKPNGGYGHSMNCGLAVASGEYIGILEPDDFADHKQYETLYSIASKENCDVVKANYYEYETKMNTSSFMEVLSEFEYNKVFSSRENEKIIYMRPCIWTAIYRREFLTANHITFNETPGASYQDTAFAFKVWACAERICLIKDAFLHYRIDNENSSVNSSGKVFSICDEFHSILSFLNLDQEKKKRFMRLLQVLKFDSYYWNLERIADEFKTQFRDQMALEFIKADYDGFLKREDFDEWRWSTLQQIIADYKGTSEKCAEAERLVTVYADSYSYKFGYALLQPLRLFQMRRSGESHRS